LIRKLEQPGRYAILLTLVLVCAWNAGCSRSGIKLYPVRGQVFFMDQPAAGAQVVFQPLGESNTMVERPTATVGADGSFALQTYPHGQGAPAGEYGVIISWMPENARDMPNPQNKLPTKYADTLKPALTATVKQGNNDLPAFRLTK
jgi:hypothetical protein